MIETIIIAGAASAAVWFSFMNPAKDM